MLFKVIHACLSLEGYQELQNKGNLSISWLRSELMIEEAVMDWEGGDKVQGCCGVSGRKRESVYVGAVTC